ncbi:hypothetical protein [Pseudazoarcus pumilus]|uniref:Uncharacterized protein n=1 Tax=Pseudazoarcus pumilus TaxID=2067960 RepID=A0A2I6S882_9RHOO|nr:hypothetical protein [Pseudazoarcus pumilus]AUN95421.1 hypothetical protein C0099_11070 [Pseudazoarcus pumilus]
MKVTANGIRIPHRLGWSVSPSGVLRLTWLGVALVWVSRAVPWCRYALDRWRGCAADSVDDSVLIEIEGTYHPGDTPDMPAVFRWRRP